MLTIFAYIFTLDYYEHEQKAHGLQSIGVANKNNTLETIQNAVKPVFFSKFDSFIVLMSRSEA